ncbi:MAG: response regulator [Dehalococcoidia bacterium]|jgi:CheY-like chemotaxis protein
MMEELAPLVILLVEDDLGDQKLIKISLRNERIANALYTVQTGEEGMDFLYRRGNYSGGTSQPDLILLDLNMPGMGGKEFLRRIKEDERLKQIPVVILTTSEAEKDIIDSYKLQASGYVHKPVTLEEFKEAMKKLKEYWFLLCKRVPK